MTGVNTNVPCKGNGKTLGMTDGTDNFGLNNRTNYALAIAKDRYGLNVGSSSSGANNTQKTIGITTDATNSGIVGTVTRSVFSVKFIIKY